MTRILARIVLGVFGVVFLMGCQQVDRELAMPTLELPTAVPTLPIAKLPTTVYATVIPTNTPLPTQTAEPTSVPSTPTPNPPIILAVSAEWETAVAPLISQLNTPRQPWQMQVFEAPEMLLADGQTQLALSENGAGTIVFQEPLALTLPWITDWEFITLADAQDIIANGHQLVSVLPWSQITPDQKALRVDGLAPDDPAYPLQTTLYLQTAEGMDTAVAQLQPLLQTALAPEPVVHLAAVGDIMLDRGLGYNLSQDRLAYPFAKVVDVLSVADITVGNVESSMGVGGEPAPKAYPFRAPPQAAEALALAGFDVVSLANNHGMDYGPETLLQALDLLQAQNVAPIGAGANRDTAHTPFVTEVNGLSLAFLGYVNVPVEASSAFDVATWDATDTTPGLAWGEPELVAADVSAVADQVDLTIVVLHSGFEYIEEPGEEQVAIAKAAIDAGADLIIGHHAHILQGIEYYNGGVIIYGLGNFAFEIDGDPSTAVMNIWLDKDGVRELELVPAIIQFGGQPRLAEEWEARPIKQQVYYLTRILNPR
ncbi:MAG: CapA family protein [Chloroflexi bacterium]|nr:CapA family protein [Chloroflexota bacterium]